MALTGTIHVGSILWKSATHAIINTRLQICFTLTEGQELSRHESFCCFSQLLVVFIPGPAWLQVGSGPRTWIKKVSSWKTASRETYRTRCDQKGSKKVFVTPRSLQWKHFSEMHWWHGIGCTWNLSSMTFVHHRAEPFQAGSLKTGKASWKPADRKGVGHNTSCHSFLRALSLPFPSSPLTHEFFSHTFMNFPFMLVYWCCVRWLWTSTEDSEAVPT